ncbi:MAG: PaaI family thioesterase [Aggregatilineales bacterium]
METGDTKHPIGGSTFVFGDVPAGFGAQFYLDDEGTVTGTVKIDSSKQGPPGHAHGGSLATLIDEAMGAACWQNGYRVLAVNLNFNYKRPVPLGAEVTITGRVERKDGRKIHTRGAVILSDGGVAVEGTGIFVEAPQYFGGKDPFTTPPTSR